MEKVRIIEIKESIFADNDKKAEEIRSELKRLARVWRLGPGEICCVR